MIRDYRTWLLPAIVIYALTSIFIIAVQSATRRILMKLDEALQLIDTKTNALADAIKDLGEVMTAQVARLDEVFKALQNRGVELTEPEAAEVVDIVARLGSVQNSAGTIASQLAGIAADPKDPVPEVPAPEPTTPDSTDPQQ